MKTLYRPDVGRQLMFIDASVIVAILGNEPGSEELEKRLASAGGPFFVSPLVKFEASAALGDLAVRASAHAASRSGMKPT